MYLKTWLNILIYGLASALNPFPFCLIPNRTNFCHIHSPVVGKMIKSHLKMARELTVFVTNIHSKDNKYANRVDLRHLANCKVKAQASSDLNLDPSLFYAELHTVETWIISESK